MKKATTFRRCGAGFTLIELLIVAAVFSVAFLLATSVFVGIQSTQRGIAGRQRIVADGRYILEAMARTARLGTIDYAYYRDPDGDGNVSNMNLLVPVSILVVRDQTGQQICYQLSGTKLQTQTGTGNCGGSWVDITPNDIDVTLFKVMITPASNPFLGTRVDQDLDCGTAGVLSDGLCLCNDATDGADNDRDTVSCLPEQRCVAPSATAAEVCLNVNRQPTVTLVLETENVNQSSGEQSRITLQTTVTSRTQLR